MSCGSRIFFSFITSLVFGIQFFLVEQNSFAQNIATVYGIVKDSVNKPLPLVNVSIFGTPNGTTTNDKGMYSLSVPANQEVSIAFSFIGFRTEKITVKLATDERKEINKTLKTSATQLKDITIEDKQERSTNIVRIDAKVFSVLPNPSGNFEAILKTFPGVSSNNEMSSQYNVRGGNYDENLVYVNDIEIYRPFLIRSGQQEGLSFVNSDLTSSILFSAGGFDAKYGDKMSSVLDITYTKPKKFAGSADISLLGGALHLEGNSPTHKWTYLLGIRQKSNQYVLGGMETKGDYKPSFTDVQSYITFSPNEKFELDFLGNISQNKYQVIPKNRNTDFGTINQALRLTVYFDGQEMDSYSTYMGALSATYRPTNNLKLKFISSSFFTSEDETFDIQGQYWIDALERDIGKPNFGDVAFNMGVGTFLDHARNYLDAVVYNTEHKGFYTYKNDFLQWGIKYQHESIADKLNEWKMIDSAGYSLPQEPDSLILLQEVVTAKNNLTSNRYSGYVQNTFNFNNTITLTAGIRANYWDLNKEFVASPRLALSIKPQWEKDVVFRVSSGYYYQPPFYRELRDLEGNIHSDIKAQRSIHFVSGGDLNFKAWGRPFKYVTEIYYKFLDNLIPYEIDNVRIRYLPTEKAHGYATGIDMRINGEFVPSVESWASLSVMKTQEDIEGDYYYDYYNKQGEQIISGYTLDNLAVDSVRHEPGYIPRPTDQRVNFSLFFQDYLPKYPTYKMHLNLLFGTGLPFGPPGYARWKDVLTIPPYRRVDIGFSKQIIGENVKRAPNVKFLHYFNAIWVSAEVFNLLQVSNTISYLWVMDVTGRQYAVPNYLTARQLNVRLNMKF